nr:hypothetical protein [Tanacetum cinerariifolium]
MKQVCSGQSYNDVRNEDGQFGLPNAGVSQPGADVGVVQGELSVGEQPGAGVAQVQGHLTFGQVQGETSVGQEQGGTGSGDVGRSSCVRSGSSILLSPLR